MRWCISGLAVLSVVAGCAGQDYAWQKAGGATQAETQRDAYECERDARMAAASFGRGTSASREAQSFFGRCMVSKGYALAPASTYTGSLTSQPVYPPTPQRDSTGRTYADDDRAMCIFPGMNSAVPLQAKACARGGGTITGPASSK